MSYQRENELYIYYEACQDPSWLPRFLEKSKVHDIKHLDWDYINKLIREDQEHDHRLSRIAIMCHALRQKIIVQYYTMN